MSRGELQLGKKGSWEVLYLPEMALRSLKTARRSERGDRLEQVACQVADLALEMTEDALREASMYLRRCASEQALRCSCTADSTSWDHQALGERPRRPKGIEVLAASTKKREKERAAWWMLTVSTPKEGDAQEYMIGKHPNGSFCSRIWGDECWGDELERGGGQSQWGDGQSQGQGECATHSGERETQELMKYRGMNGSQWNDGGAWERRGRSGFPDQRK